MLGPVIDREIETSLAPVLRAPFGFGLFDALLRRRDEIPPDVAGTRKGRAAEDHQPSTLAAGRDRDPVARPEDHHLRCLIFLASNRDRTFDDVHSPVFVI